MVWWILTIICIVLLILIGIFHYVYIFPANMMKKIEKDYKCLFDYSGKNQKNNKASVLTKKKIEKIAEETVNETEIKKPKKPKKSRSRKPKSSNKSEK